MGQSLNNLSARHQREAIAIAACYSVAAVAYLMVITGASLPDTKMYLGEQGVRFSVD